MKRFKRPYRVKTKSSFLKSRFFLFTILIFIISVEVFYILFFSPFFQIKEVKIFNNEKIPTEKLKELIQRQISYNFFKGRLKSESIFLANLKKIDKELHKMFPQIALINFKKKFPDTLIVRIDERKPVAIFLQDKKSFFIDQEGLVFESLELDNFNQRFFKIKDLTLKRDFVLGEKIIDKERLDLILNLVLKLKEKIEISTEEILIASEERLNVKTAEGWEIYFNLKDDLSWQMTKLDLVLKERVTPEKRKNLQYIDLRFEKIFISFKDSE